MPSLWCWRSAVASHSALVVLVALREWSALGLVLAAVLATPLPGLLRQQVRTAAWGAMLVAFYVAGYLAAGYAHPAEKAQTFSLAALAALDYLSLLGYVRMRARERAAIARSAAGTAPSDDAAR